MSQRAARVIWIVVAICSVPAALATGVWTILVGYAEAESMSTGHHVGADFYGFAAVTIALPLLFVFALYKIVTVPEEP
jgi:hypothetical protein